MYALNDNILLCSAEERAFGELAGEGGDSGSALAGGHCGEEGC